MIIIVVGMHRSGTSAMAGVLANNGVYMGEGHYHPAPSKENPKGFFENREFRVINDQLLRMNGYQVKSFSPAVPSTEAMVCPYAVEAQMATLVNRYNNAYVNWGFKDPRTALTLRFWLRAIFYAVPQKECKVIMMNRDSLSVAVSMQSRGNKGLLQKFAALSHSYYKQARAQYKNYIEVQYKNLIYQPDDTLTKLGARLGIKLENKGFIEERLGDRAGKN